MGQTDDRNASNSISLSGLLHDARLMSIEQDRAAGSCHLNCEYGFLDEVWGLDDSTSHSFTMTSVSRIILAPYIEEANSEKSWEIFVARVNDLADGDIYEADLFPSGEGLCLRIVMSLRSGTEWYKIDIIGENLLCSRSDGWTGTVGEIEERARIYWEKTYGVPWIRASIDLADQPATQ